jgi:peptidoglycan/LPS O-acetylase OafA/YrhL
MVLRHYRRASGDSGMVPGDNTLAGFESTINLDRNSNDSSITLDFLRALAAQMVCVGHALNFFGVGDALKPPQFPYMQNIGVLLFFVMSGFLITATLVQKSRNPRYYFSNYFIDRFARIYSGLLPALMLIVVVDGVTILVTSDPVVITFYNLKTFVANLAMMEVYRGVSRGMLTWGSFGTAAPLWTLAIEFQIYMFIGALFFIARRRGAYLLLLPILLFFGQTPLHFLFGALQSDGVGTGLFALWLAGGAAYFALSAYIPPRWFSGCALVASLILYAFLVQPGHEHVMLTYPALAVAVTCMIAYTQRTKIIGSNMVARIIRVMAAYSLTLYLIHYTIMYAIVGILKVTGPVAFFGAVLLANALAIALAIPFEMKHKQFAKWIDEIVFRQKLQVLVRSGE